MAAPSDSHARGGFPHHSHSHNVTRVQHPAVKAWAHSFCASPSRCSIALIVCFWGPRGKCSRVGTTGLPCHSGLPFSPSPPLSHMPEGQGSWHTHAQLEQLLPQNFMHPLSGRGLVAATQGEKQMAAPSPQLPANSLPNNPASTTSHPAANSQGPTRPRLSLPLQPIRMPFTARQPLKSTSE